jgi:hypothetical protein
MLKHFLIALALLLITAGMSLTALGRGRPDPAALITAQLEVGERILPGREPVRFFEMNLKRVGDTNWPAAGAIPPK